MGDVSGGRPFEVGVYVDAHLGIGEQARALEDAGFDHLWVYDSPLVFGDVYMALLEAARATERIAIGPGVTQPLARPAVAAAQAMATLAKAAPGRTFFGTGIGNSARWSLGQRPATQDVLFEHLRVVQALLRGEEVVADGRPIRFLNPEGRWIDVAHDVPAWVSAFGPRGQARAAAVADGILVRWEGAEALAIVRERVADAARAAGRDPSAVKIGLVTALYPIGSDAELREEDARLALGPLVVSRMRYLTANHASAAEVPEPFRPGFDAYLAHRAGLPEETRHVDNYRGYLTHVPPDLEPFVRPETMHTIATIGSPERIADELRAMREAGADAVTLQVAGPPASWCRRMGDEVLPALAPALRG